MVNTKNPTTGEPQMRRMDSQYRLPEKALSPNSEGKKWPASTTLNDLRSSTFCALFERNPF